MNIDRSRFLLLTAALSATAACTTAQNSTPDGGTTPTDSGADATTDASHSDGAVDAADAGALDSGTDAVATCDDTVGDVTACAPFAEGGSGSVDAGDGGNPTCFSVSGAQVCNTVSSVKPKIGQAIIDCAMADPTCEGLAPCVATALGAACDDPTAAGTCAPLVAQCADAGSDAGLSATDCTKYVSGLNDTGRANFTACMEEGFVCDLQACLGQL